MRSSLARFTVGLSVAATFVVCPSRARAQSAGDAPRSSQAAVPEPVRGWYGWQTLVADGASVMAFTGALALYRPSSGGAQDLSAGLLVLAGSGYVVGAPALHLAHDAPWKAAGSFGMRLGLPAAGLFAGLALAPRCSGLRCMDGLGSGAVGALLGLVGAIVVDAAVLAFEPAPLATKRVGAASAWNLAPRMDPLRGEVGVSLGATGW
jgi:hypothetical protein